MQRRKNTMQTLKFIYAFIIFISLFLAITNGNQFPCKIDVDCLIKDCFRPFKPMCIVLNCECVLEY
ncbi:putative Late nodulin [Medicago truncatula]|uniref:Putative Late nodulin n=1 Tax=Medicago truncatula TaxID=3880 RepID=A0A396IN36_MEDTR|nr:putative Late nodulin [Medicago truncatula]